MEKVKIVRLALRNLNNFYKQHGHCLKYHIELSRLGTIIIKTTTYELKPGTQHINQGTPNITRTFKLPKGMHVLDLIPETAQQLLIAFLELKALTP